MVRTSSRHDDPSADARPHQILSIGWFVLLVVAGGFLTFLQDMLLGTLLPVEVALRFALLCQALCVMAFVRTRARPLPGILVLPIILLSASMIVTPVVRLIEGDDVVLTLRAFYFMFGIGAFLVFLPFIPLMIGHIRLFAAFSIASVLFATLQILSQDLYLSDSLRAEFGLLFDLFTNGRLRAVSFFASAPRFAEFLVFILSWLMCDMISRGRFILLKMLVYGICLWVLVNTYSRSGYILFIVATAVIVFVQQRRIFGARNMLGMLARLVAGCSLVLLLTVVIGSIEVDWGGLLDPTSLQARFSHWAFLQDRIAGFTTVQYLFGSGDAAMFSRSEVEYFVVDNLYVALFIYSGFFGLFSLLFLFMSTVAVALSEMHQPSGSRLLPVFAFYIGLYVQALFVDNHNTLFLAQLAIVAMVRANRIIPRES